MTDERRKELFDSALFWITSHIHDDDEIYNSLHNVIGMTDFEIVECNIDYLSEYFTDRPNKTMLFSKVTLTADNGSTDEILCSGIVNCEEDLENADLYNEFLEDNPDAESIEVDSKAYSFGEGESENADDEDLMYIVSRGDEFLDSDEVDEIESSHFIILTDNEDFDEEDEESFRMGGL